MNELIELAENFEQKTKELHEVATKIDGKWRVSLRERRKFEIFQTDNNI